MEALNMTLHQYLDTLKNKTVAVVGIGVSNPPWLRRLLQEGIRVTACDKRSRDALGALAVSLLEVVRTYTGVELAFLDLLPLASLDFGWVLPAAVCGAVGALIPRGRAARHRRDPLHHHRGRRIRYGHRTVPTHAHLKGKQP